MVSLNEWGSVVKMDTPEWRCGNSDSGEPADGFDGEGLLDRIFYAIKTAVGGNKISAMDGVQQAAMGKLIEKCKELDFEFAYCLQKAAFDEVDKNECFEIEDKIKKLCTEK